MEADIDVLVLPKPAGFQQVGRQIHIHQALVDL